MKKLLKKNKSFASIITYFGTEEALAKKLNISQQAVSQWRYHGIPAFRVPELIKLTNGFFSPQELRPDIYNIDRRTLTKS